MSYRLEVVQVPVSDVDRAKAFYTEQAGFRADHDTQVSDTTRVVQLTPPGSACSILIGTGLSTMEPGSVQGLQLVVADMEAARGDLVGRGVEVGPVQDLGRPGGSSFKHAWFSDPDGNVWVLQEIREEAPPMTASAPVVTGVDFVSVPTEDYARAADFYGRVLDLPCIEVYDRVPGGEFQAGHLTLQVFDFTKIGRGFQANPYPIALQVDDIEAARTELESRGVVFTEGFDTGVCHNAFFEDPDGNALLLHQRYAPK